MPTPDSNSVLKALREGANLARQVGLEGEALGFEQLHARFETEKPTLKLLRSEVEPARNDFALKIRKMLLDDHRNPRPGMESLTQEYYRISNILLHLTYPPQPRPASVDISGFSGGDCVEQKMVPYFGDVSQVRHIVERTIELIQRYTAFIGHGDFDAAYSLTATGLREWMSKKRFLSDHAKAAREYHGPALEYSIDQFQFIYADDLAREKSKVGEGWPKTTPKEQRRSCVTGFWIRDRAAQTGCWGGFLVSEEQNEYRIAGFTFYTQ